MEATREAAGVHLVSGIRKWDFVALVLNSIVGAGIFGLPSRAYALAGVQSLLAYVVCAVPVFLIVLCFAEVSSRFKDTGGPYLYARATFGLFVGFEIGWLSWLVRLTAFAALCNLFVIRLSTYAVTCAALPILRRKSASEQAPFVVPAGRTVSMVALILIAWLFSNSSGREILQAAVAAAAGLLMYVVMAARRVRRVVRAV